MSNKWRLAIAVTVFILSVTSAVAESVRFEFEGLCKQHCESVGLAADGRVYGHLVVDSMWLVGPENAQILVLSENVQEFQLNFGNQAFTTSDLVFDGWSGFNFWYSRNVLNGTMIVMNGSGVNANNGFVSLVFAGSGVPATNVFIYESSAMASGIFRDTRSGFVPERLLNELLDSMKALEVEEAWKAQGELALAHYSNPSQPKTCVALADLIAAVSANKAKKKQAMETDTIVADAQRIMETIGCNFPAQ